MKQYIIKEENINYINCNNPTEAEICLTIETLMGIYVQQLGFIDYLTHWSGSNAIYLFYTSKRSHSLGSVNLELSLIVFPLERLFCLSKFRTLLNVPQYFLQ